MERISKSVVSFFEEKRDLFKAKRLVERSDWMSVVGFKDEGADLGDILSGFEGDQKLVMRDVIKKGVGEYPFVCVTGFDNDDRVTGRVEIRRRV